MMLASRKSKILVVGNDSHRLNLIGKAIQRKSSLWEISFCNHVDEAIDMLRTIYTEEDSRPVLVLMELDDKNREADLKNMESVRNAKFKNSLPLVVFVPTDNLNEDWVAWHGGNIVLPITANDNELEQAVENVASVWLQTLIQDEPGIAT